jgi:NAD(P)-dependent dehydrogenase (short-subunit alcohol dehydrogenase family)
MAEMFASLDWNDMKGVHRHTSGLPIYGRAKLSLLLFTLELQRRLRLAGAQVEAFAVHPGELPTVHFANCNWA